MYLLFIILMYLLPFSFQTSEPAYDKSVCDSGNKEYMGIEVYVEATLDEPLRQTTCESEIHKYGASVSNGGLNISVDLLNCFLNFHTVGVYTNRDTVYAKFASLDPWTTEPMNSMTHDDLVKLTEECIVDIYLKCEVDKTKDFMKTNDNRLKPRDFKTVPPSNVGSMIELQSDYCVNDVTAYVKIYDECGNIKQHSIPTLRDYFTTKNGQPRKILKKKIDNC
ncbi:Chemokine binding protein [Monkeypox virus]|uniref:Protein OPG170 n=4 Tax=Monkeypox virus TaxID=10244 RepID=PG170_MONPV|nr:Chemokine binding protein [Monkeypox virus]A0A7H0DND8.1 RecName: Full=Protein OPG170; Flags: Precursor [Monkeypox virus]AUW64231.1 bifunctional secreted glycoprotein [Monkeypox virus]AUW64379.1 bifunctional secreted glycoprotein [Monkeypox virus]QNP12478.1 MPXVgp151 [Monkeypox virus]QNP12659.1 MPXVgp151 [Monkeypox virus]QNP12840.1 MPXVgp151 [Monkeypox virus]